MNGNDPQVLKNMNRFVRIEKRREQFGLTGPGCSWRHVAMDWREAIALREKVIHEVRHSLRFPLYGSSVWTVPCLLARGPSLLEDPAWRWPAPHRMRSAQMAWQAGL